MTTKTTNTDKRSWVVRKGAYFIFGGLLAIAAIFGWITTEQADEWLDIAARTIESVAAAALIFAGTKTHRGSDDDTTKDDVVEAAKEPTSKLDDLVKALKWSVADEVNTLRENLVEQLGGKTLPGDATYDAPRPEPTITHEQRGGTYPKGQ